MVVDGNPRKRRGRISEAVADHTPENIEAIKLIMQQETCACILFLNIECVHAPCTCIAVTTAVACTLPKLAPQCCGNNCRACAFS